LFLVCALSWLAEFSWFETARQWGSFCGGFFALGLPGFGVQFTRRLPIFISLPMALPFQPLSAPHTRPSYGARQELCRYLEVGPATRMVAWNFTPDNPAMVGARYLQSSSGYEAALPDTYGMKPQQLADNPQQPASPVCQHPNA
jgi:hypothetical protein